MTRPVPPPPPPHVGLGVWQAAWWSKTWRGRCSCGEYVQARGREAAMNALIEVISRHNARPVDRPSEYRQEGRQ